MAAAMAEVPAAVGVARSCSRVVTVIRGLVSNVTCVVDIECFWVVAPPCSWVELRVRCGHVAVSPGLIKPDRCVKWDVKQHSKIERAGALITVQWQGAQSIWF